MIRLYVWDAAAGWYGYEAPHASGKDACLARRAARRPVFHVELECQVEGYPRLKLRTSAYDVRDGGAGLIDSGDSISAPLAAVFAIPASRRPHARPDLAFEFASFLKFLRILDAGSELSLHDSVAEALASAPAGEALAFCVIAPDVDYETSIVLSPHVERVCALLVEWMEPALAIKAAPVKMASVHRSSHAQSTAQKALHRRRSRGSGHGALSHFGSERPH